MKILRKIILILGFIYVFCALLEIFVFPVSPYTFSRKAGQIIEAIDSGKNKEEIKGRVVSLADRCLVNMKDLKTFLAISKNRMLSSMGLL